MKAVKYYEGGPRPTVNSMTLSSLEIPSLPALPETSRGADLYQNELLSHYIARAAAANYTTAIPPVLRITYIYLELHGFMCILICLYKLLMCL